jgi:thiosulfate dehydrogenase
MNCSNCHLDAGTKAWGNNYGSVFQYPKMRVRRQMEGLYQKNQRLPRTKLKWLHLKEEDKEMKAMIAYIEYI